MRYSTAWIGVALMAASGCGSSGHDADPGKEKPGTEKPGADAGSKPASDAGTMTVTCPGCASEDDGLPRTSKPEVFGVLMGPDATNPITDLNAYGTDLGFVFEHGGKLNIMFGDTLPEPDSICREIPNDDTLASLPMEFTGEVPELEFHRSPEDRTLFVPVQLMQGDESLFLGFGQAPTTAFSDGKNVFAMFDRLDLTSCGSDAAVACPTDDGFECSGNVGECQPSYKGVIPPLCDMKATTGCFGGQTCVARSKPPCIDTKSSQYDDTVAGEIAAAAENNVLGMQRPDEPDVFDAVLSWPTNKFISLTTRAIAHLDADDVANDDYSAGHETLLLWGRPRFAGEDTREAQLYLLTLDLPLQLDGDGKLKFEPHYFTGTDEKTGLPRWSSRQADAAALPMDGKPNGDPHELVHITNHTAISWLPAPINKWVMLYGGGLSDYLLLDPVHAQFRPAPGSIMIRYADHPWGPWSKPSPHLIPGDPSNVGDLYGPGGYLFSPSCGNAGGKICAPPDGAISTMNDRFDCAAGLVLWDTGHLYGASIIDQYTQPIDDGFELIWLASTWNPYSILMLKTEITTPKK